MIAPDTLISIIIEEAERQKERGTLHSDHRDHDKDKDEALVAAPAGKSTYRSKGKQTRRGGAGEAKDPSCWVCSSTEHKSPHHYLRNQQGGKDSKSKPTSTSRESVAHVVAAESDDEDGIFGVSDAWSDHGDSNVPDLLSVESSDDEDGDESINTDDWFLLTEEDDWSEDEVLEAGVDHAENLIGPARSSLENNVAMAASVDSPTSRCMELYDSGTTRHILPYHDAFETYTTIPPKPFTAANRQVFNATGIGEMVVDVPNGYDISRLRLTEVLYSKEVGYMLVSVGRLDELRLSTTFADGFYTIRGTDGETIGCIP